jgi:hypothetical protein
VRKRAASELLGGFVGKDKFVAHNFRAYRIFRDREYIQLMSSPH